MNLKAEIQKHFVRSMRGMKHLEYFLLTSVATILVVRSFLALTGYPQIGNSSLHVAHVLWGGLFMMIALLAPLLLLNPKVEPLSAFLGGIGFGLFIDEVGKFVTQDNNYFFQPAVAIMYVVFVAIFLGSRYLLLSAGYSRIEYLTNSLNEMMAIPKGELTEEDKNQILYYLKQGGSPLAAELSAIVDRTAAEGEGAPGPYERWKAAFYRRYQRVSASRWFRPAINTLFIAQAIGLGLTALAILFEGSIEDFRREFELFSFIDWAILASNAFTAIFVFWGVLLLRRSRLRAYRMFERSVLISILIGQFFAFYKEQFDAVPGFLIDILLLLGLRFLIEREESLQLEQRLAAPAASGAQRRSAA